MYNIGMLGELHGLRDRETILAEVLSKAGCATAPLPVEAMRAVWRQYRPDAKLSR